MFASLAVGRVKIGSSRRISIRKGVELLAMSQELSLRNNLFFIHLAGLYTRLTSCEIVEPRMSLAVLLKSVICGRLTRKRSYHGRKTTGYLAIERKSISHDTLCARNIARNHWNANGTTLAGSGSVVRSRLTRGNIVGSTYGKREKNIFRDISPVGYTSMQ